MHPDMAAFQALTSDLSNTPSHFHCLKPYANCNLQRKWCQNENLHKSFVRLICLIYLEPSWHLNHLGPFCLHTEQLRTIKPILWEGRDLSQYYTALWAMLEIVFISLYYYTVRGCSHITSAKIRGSWTPPPPLVSNGQHLAYPPSPPRQLSSAFARRPFCTTIFYVDLITW